MGITSSRSLEESLFLAKEYNCYGGTLPGQWKTIYRSKNEGGLGVKDLETMNVALLIKWWWRFFSDRNHLWGALIDGIYYIRRKPLAEGRSFKPYSL